MSDVDGDEKYISEEIELVDEEVLPPNFQLADPADYRPDARGVKNHKGRLEIMKQYNGLIICRAGRQIDCISPSWTKFQNYDWWDPNYPAVQELVPVVKGRTSAETVQNILNWFRA